MLQGVLCRWRRAFSHVDQTQVQQIVGASNEKVYAGHSVLLNFKTKSYGYVATHHQTLRQSYKIRKDSVRCQVSKIVEKQKIIVVRVVPVRNLCASQMRKLVTLWLSLESKLKITLEFGLGTRSCHGHAQIDQMIIKT